MALAKPQEAQPVIGADSFRALPTGVSVSTPNIPKKVLFPKATALAEKTLARLTPRKGRSASRR